MKKSEINILIVEDDPTQRGSIDETFKRAGYKTTIASRADEALTAVKVKAIHVAVIDCMLPKVNGVDLARQLRAEHLKTGPIILTSGIFRDKSFAADAVKKTGAAEFLTKPFKITDLLALVDAQMKDKMSAPKVALHALLSQPFASTRDRRKAIDQVEEIVGYDVPLILAVMMDDEFSGNITFQNAFDELFGISMVKGKITKVDSADTVATQSLLMIQHGMLRPTDLVEYQGKRRKGDFLTSLVQEQFISPHSANVILHEQMVNDIRRMVTDETFEVTMAIDRKAKEAHGISLDELTTAIHQIVDQNVKAEWFHNFYQSWKEHPMRKGPQFDKLDSLFTYPMLAKLDGLKEQLKKEPTITALLESYPADTARVYKAVHILAIRRVIVFDETRASGGQAETHERIKAMAVAFEGKNPFQIFEYFGLGESPRAGEVDKTFKEFAKVYHPDKLPQNATQETRILFNKVFGAVAEAHGTLTNEQKRLEATRRLREVAATETIRAENILEDCVNLIKKNEIEKAKAMLDTIMDANPSDETKMYWSWAAMKSTSRAKFMMTVSTLLPTISADRRAEPLYSFVNGLYKAATNDTTAAISNFKRAIELNPAFIEARRELSRLQGTGTNPRIDLNNIDQLLKADLGALAKTIFKKKSG